MCVLSPPMWLAIAPQREKFPERKVMLYLNPKRERDSREEPTSPGMSFCLSVCISVYLSKFAWMLDSLFKFYRSRLSGGEVYRNPHQNLYLCSSIWSIYISLFIYPISQLPLYMYLYIHQWNRNASPSAFIYDHPSTFSLWNLGEARHISLNIVISLSPGGPFSSHETPIPNLSGPGESFCNVISESV